MMTADQYATLLVTLLLLGGLAYVVYQLGEGWQRWSQERRDRKPTATYRRTLPSPFNEGKQEIRLYRLDPPMVEDGCRYRHVIVSAVNNGFIYETYIFGCDRHGNVQGWGELDGSYRGGTDHDRALRNAGYEVR